MKAFLAGLFIGGTLAVAAYIELSARRGVAAGRDIEHDDYDALAEMEDGVQPYDPRTVMQADALDYDPDEKVLIVTERLGPDEYGAASIVAWSVRPWFGLWAEATWGESVPRTAELATGGGQEGATR